MAERLAGLTAVAEAGQRVCEFVGMLNAAVDYPDQFEAEYVARQPSNAVYATVN